MLLVATSLFSSCGGSKQIASADKGRVEIKENECQILAKAKPQIRSWGTAQAFELSDAVAYAELDARSKMSNALATKIKAAAERSSFDLSKVASDATSTNMAQDGGAKRNRFAQSVAENTIKNTVNILTKQYKLSNGQYEVWVTLEYSGEVSAMAEEVVKKIESNLSDDDRIRIEYNINKFKKEIQAELEK